MDVPEWVIRATRSMPPGALRVMAEMYAQARPVWDIAGRQYLHWPMAMGELGVPASTVSRVLPGLVEAECLVEHPGTRMAAGRLWSTYSAPVAEPVSRLVMDELRFSFITAARQRVHEAAQARDISAADSANQAMEHARNFLMERSESTTPLEAEPAESGGTGSIFHSMEHAPDFLMERSESTEGEPMVTVESGGSGEHVPLADTKYSPMEHALAGVQTRAHVRGPVQHQQQGTARSSSSKHLPSHDSLPNVLSSPGSTTTGSEDEIAELCLVGLKAIGVGKPENVLRQFPLNSIAGALEQLVMKLARGEEVTGKGAAYVMWFLVNRAEFAPLADFGFLQYFVPSEDPKVVSFALRRNR